MKKKWMLTAVLVLAAVLLAGCTISPDGLSRLNRLAQGQSLTDSDSDTVTISRDLYERYRQFDELLELMDVVDYYYYQEPNVTDMLQGASAGLLAGLQDPYTFYYTPEAWKKMKEDDEGEYAGVGILISSNYKTGVCTISRVFKGSPAEAAGVQRGDILYRIGEDLYVVPETLQDAVDIMRGTPGTSVDVTFLRDGEEITFNLTRANITVNQVESTMLTEEIGLIAVYEFAGKVDAEFEEALNDLISRGAKGLIIDLRDNPGGYVNAVCDILRTILPEGLIVYTEDKHGNRLEETCEGETPLAIPLAVLVNKSSASASEIFAGAVQDHGTGLIVGEKTYGKGIVQSIRTFSDGSAVKLTTSQYYTPDGHYIHEVGIAPDIEVTEEEQKNASEEDVYIEKALQALGE